MPYGVTTTGFARKPVATIIDEINADLRATISPNLNVTIPALIANLIGVVGSKLGEVWEVNEEVYRAGDRAGASGDGLDSIGGLIGVPRAAATKSTVAATVVVGAGFSAAAGEMIASVNGDPTIRFVSAEDVASAGGGTIVVAFEAETAGAVAAPAGTLEVIANPLTGWTSVTNVLDAEIGTEIETDAAYRARQVSELARVGSTTVDAIRADVLALALDGVTSCTVLENDTDGTVDGMPPHSVEAIVEGGTDEAVAEAIFRAKAGGIRAHGSTSETVVDSQGEPHTIGFTRPTNVLLWLGGVVNVDASAYPGVAAVEAAITSWAQANLEVGSDVVITRIIAILMGLPGIEDVPSILLGASDPPVGTTNYTIGTRQIAKLDSSRINFTFVAV